MHEHEFVSTLNRDDDGLHFGSRFRPEEFCKPTLEVARMLLGSVLVHASPQGIAAGRIVEVEAYLGPEDKGSHSYGGKLTDRNRAMFGPRGHAYIYLIYGMYWCFNVVTGPPELPQAVLVRALDPVAGIELMRERLGQPHAPVHSLCRGPGKLCKALGITGKLYGEPLWGDRLFLVPGTSLPPEAIGTSARINIPYAGDYAHAPWRFYVRNHPAVSGPAKLRR
jgi:DNA-3-methyladenine glycosylase